MVAFLIHQTACTEGGIASGELRSSLLMLPVKALPLCVATFDVVLRERPLQAVRAKHTMLSRMARFTRAAVLAGGEAFDG